ncbi:RNA polymerase associated protein RapA, partial [hydrothermal vent metagenome]
SLKTHFPSLIDDGMSVTFDRNTALSNEMLHFLTWEHPMVVGAMEMIATEEKGNACLISIQNTGLKPSTIIIESLFSLQAPADAQLQISRYLPADSTRLVACEKLIERTKILTSQLIYSNHASVPLNVALQVIKMKQKEIKNIINAIENKADRILPDQIKQAQDLANTELDEEINRLKALQKVNNNVRIEEIEFLQQQKQQTLDALSQAQTQMNAIRVLVCV